MSGIEEYRLEIKIKNNLIMRKIESLGYSSLPKFCEETGICYPSLINVINMKTPIFDAQGNLRNFVAKLCMALQAIPDELFTATQMEASLKTNKRTLQVKEAEVKFYLENQDNTKLLEDIVYEDQTNNAIESAIDTLYGREKKVIEMRFGLNGELPHTLEEVSQKFGVGRERIRQIEAKALRKLRHPGRCPDLHAISKEIYDES